MSVKDRQAARDRFIKLGQSASDEELDRACSNMHLGILLNGMIDCIVKAKEVAPSMGIDLDSDEYSATLSTATIITQKATQDNFKVTLNFASAAECEEFKREMEGAQELPE